MDYNSKYEGNSLGVTFVSAVDTEILNLSKTKPLEWKKFIDDIFSLWMTERKEIAEFITLPNRYHPTVKFTAEIKQEISQPRTSAGEALTLLRTNSSAKSFYVNIYNFKKRFLDRGY